MPGLLKKRGLRIAIDRGGTFTDCVCRVPSGSDIVIKILSVDSQNYEDAPTEAIRQVLERFYGRSVPRGSAIDLQDVEVIRMGTTVATNALLERKGQRTAFLVTEGFKDLLQIGNQSRPYMFDLRIRRNDVLYSAVREVSERVLLDKCTEGGSRADTELPSPQSLRTVSGVSGELVRVIKNLDEGKTREQLQNLYDEGFRALAVCLMHSYTFDEHECRIEEIAREVGFKHISLSSRVSRRSKIVPRGNSTVVDCYLTPVIDEYLNQFLKSFPNLGSTRLEFMQSDGGLVPFTRISGLRSILSGPAGGVVGYARTCFDAEDPIPVIGFDIGGTSTDVSRYDGKLEHVFETVTAGTTIQSPQLDIHTIAAGGGSVLTWREGMMAVGPESASSNPGPACYRKGGPATITDANLVLGRLVPEFFPSVFGPNEDQPLDALASRLRLEELASIISTSTGKSLTVEELAEGFIKIANSTMSCAIRALTENRGFATSSHNLASFGGAGGQHACGVAEECGIKTVIVHKHSSVLSAHGIGLADVVQEAQMPCAVVYDQASLPQIRSSLHDLEEETKTVLIEDGNFGTIITERFVNMRYEGSDTAIMTKAQPGDDPLKEFILAHHREFGFTPENRGVFVDSLRVRAVGRDSRDATKGFLKESKYLPLLQKAPSPDFFRSVCFEQGGWTNTPVFVLDSLSAGTRLRGPALIIDKTQTILVTPNSEAVVLEEMLVINVSESEKPQVSSTMLDPIQLAVFRHRFFGVAEQMGRVLQKTSVSANIKERLDFSCAIFSPTGELVANAPHVPAMIGSMGFAVKAQIAKWQGQLQNGDVLLSNSPAFGGVHLPDFTVITPVFDASGTAITFWTASRGHHADVGGIRPGSMPPDSHALWQEGAVFDSFLLVRGGRFNEAELVHSLVDTPAQFPDCSGTRCLQDNVTDLKAQVAANNCGARLIQALIAAYSMPVVQYYMGAIQDAAESAIRSFFRRLHQQQGGGDAGFSATDYMDDGTPIALTISPRADGSATFDFSGTGPQVYGNWNAPIAITNSAVIYALRCLVDADIPLNHGCMRPVDIVVPASCLLSPSHDVAVCAGNVLTSQRIVDVVFQALQACACSQGCMNNFTFGIDGDDDRGFGYYETIAGGSGAGPSWVGTSGVHTNMTNTRITDPESLERRYPVVLREFGMREGSGGVGLHRGGDGVVRDVEFRVPMTASILSERRSRAPPGMNGGGDGQPGRNLWVQKSGTVCNVGGKNSVKVAEGDRMVICTPGGGAWGAEAEGRKVAVSI